MDKDPVRNRLTETSLSMVSSSQESDFCGFSPSIAANKIAQCSQDKVGPTAQNNDMHINGHPLSGSLLKRAIRSTECSSAQTVASEEFSDQDVRCRTEMEKHDARLRSTMHENENLCNESNFSIEPTSSDDENDELSCRAAALKICKTSSNLHTLSVNENSNNAVDNAISSASYTTETELTDLSFNGKLKPDASNNTTDSIIELHKENKTNNVTVSNDKSNLELQLQLESSREQINERSPDLFSDDDDCGGGGGGDGGDNEADNNEQTNVDANDSIASTKSEDKENNSDNCIEKTERSISKRIQNLLCGILPPPSVTYVQHDISNLLSMYKRNVALMHSEQCNEDAFVDQPSHPIIPKPLENVEWPQISKINAYGLHYNRTKYTENIEMLFMKLVERNVGQETSSSFTYVSASAKKKPARKL